MLLEVKIMAFLKKGVGTQDESPSWIFWGLGMFQIFVLFFLALYLGVIGDKRSLVLPRKDGLFYSYGYIWSSELA